MVSELAVLVEDLHAMVVGVCHDDLLVHSQTETVRRVELILRRTKLPKLGPKEEQKKVNIGEKLRLYGFVVYNIPD